MPKVLVVEDDFIIADCLEEILIEAGYEVCGITGSVADAIELGREHNPDLGILDFQLARGEYGTSVAAALHDNGRIGVLYATGTPDHPLLLKGRGADDCVAKPYTAQTILSALQRLSQKMLQTP